MTLREFFNRDRIIIIILCIIIISLLIHSTILFIQLEFTKGCIGFMMDFMSTIKPDFEPEEDDVFGVFVCGLYLEKLQNDYEAWRESQN